MERKTDADVAAAESGAEESVKISSRQHEGHRFRRDARLEFDLASIEIELGQKSCLRQFQADASGIAEQPSWLRSLIIERDTETCIGERRARRKGVTDANLIWAQDDAELI